MNWFREPEDTPKFVPTQADREAYSAIAINRIIPEQDGLLVQAYNYFKDQLLYTLDSNGDAISPAKVLTTLEHALQVVMINLGDSDDPYLIFESLNFKGEPLNQADLVRNYVLMRFRHSIAPGGEQQRVYLNYWRPMEDLLGQNHSVFLRHYAMKNGDDIRQGGIYAAVKTHLKNMETAEKVEAEIKRMQTFATFYARFLDSSQESNTPVQKRLEHIRSLNVTTSYPLLLRLFGTRADGTLSDLDLEKCLGLVEAFFIRRAVCVVPTNQLNKLFLQWAKHFPEQDYVVWLHTAMSSGGGGRRFPADAEFEEAFKNQPQYGRGSTRFILCQLEESFDHKEPVDLTTATIEHVLPQAMTPEWESELGPDHQAIYTRYLNTIGNLTLTGYNPELGNIPFAEKKAKLENTHIELNRWILQKEHWGEAEIKDRATELFSKAASNWPGPIVMT